jgi:hypothetical protein
MTNPLTNKAALDAVRALHCPRRSPDSPTGELLWVCEECFSPWPCRTVQAIGGEK